MDVQALRQSIDAIPGTMGQHMGRRIALDRIAAGSLDHAAAIVGLAGLDAIPALVAAGAPPAVLRAAIRYAVLHHHKALPALDRAEFAWWCRAAEFELPGHLGTETVTVARGTYGCTPEQNAAGMHWSLGGPGSDAFDGAAFFAAYGPGPIVVVARVPRSALIYFVDGAVPYETLIDTPPAEFEAITDTMRILRGAARFAYHQRATASSGRAKGFTVAEANAAFADELIAHWEGWHRARGLDPAAALRVEPALAA